MHTKLWFVTLATLLIVTGCDTALSPERDEMGSLQATGKAKQIGINIVLKTPVTDEILADLSKYGPVLNVYPEIDVVRIRGRENQLGAIRALPFVEAADPDAEVNIPPHVSLPVDDMSNGLSMWNLDAINVTDPLSSPVRTVPQDGAGVYVGVLDTGLLKNWRYYFPEERIAVEYARSFGGGGTMSASVSDQPNKWEHDTNSHGTHVTSTILGFALGVTPVNGVAPKATVIPVKVLNQNGSSNTSVVIEGILYMARLKEGPLSNHPVIVNMSLGGPRDAALHEAVKYAINQGVIIVASAGNVGEQGMGYPGAFEEVISVAASGWVGEWTSGTWYLGNVAEPTDPGEFYITDFSSRELTGQHLDIAAPGSWVVGPFQIQQGQTSFFFLGGTSMASPHVAGVVALMAQQNTALTAPEAETILKDTAIKLSPGCLTINTPSGTQEEVCWGSDATGAGLLDADAALARL